MKLVLFLSFVLFYHFCTIVHSGNLTDIPNSLLTDHILPAADYKARALFAKTSHRHHKLVDDAYEQEIDDIRSLLKQRGQRTPTELVSDIKVILKKHWLDLFFNDNLRARVYSHAPELLSNINALNATEADKLAILDGLLIQPTMQFFSFRTWSDLLVFLSNRLALAFFDESDGGLTKNKLQTYLPYLYEATRDTMEEFGLPVNGHRIIEWSDDALKHMKSIANMGEQRLPGKPHHDMCSVMKPFCDEQLSKLPMYEELQQIRVEKVYRSLDLANTILHEMVLKVIDIYRGGDAVMQSYFPREEWTKILHGVIIFKRSKGRRREADKLTLCESLFV